MYNLHGIRFKIGLKMLEEKSFSRLSLTDKLEMLRKEGVYLGARETFAHYVYLYSLRNTYVEAYRVKNLNQFQWIEIQKNKEIIQEYVGDISLRNLGF